MRRGNFLVWVVVILFIFYLAWRVIEPLISPIFFAAVLVYAVNPIHKRLSSKIGEEKSFILLTILLVLIVVMITVELILLFKKVMESVYTYVDLFLKWFETLTLPFGMEEAIQKAYSQIMPKLSEYTINYTLSIPKYLIQTVIFLAVFYYFLTHAESIKMEIYSLLPRDNRELAEKLLRRADLTLQALIRSWLLLNIAKGIVMTAGFLIFGVTDLAGSIGAGLFTILFSFIPLFEGWMVWLIGAIYLIKNGNPTTALLLSIYGFTLVSPLPDFTIRPKIVAKEAKLDSMMVLIGMIGGTMAFGLKGLIAGPIVLNLVSALIKEWKRHERAKAVIIE
jgi:predicted PurR-regulated permease PerM